MAQNSRPCRGCGATILRTVPVAPVPHYCGPDCRPRCSVPDCGKPVHANGMCSAHATRAARYGDPLAPKQRGRNEGPCSVDGCDQPMRKTGYCANHYAMWHQRGEIREWTFKWGTGEYVATHNRIKRYRGLPGSHSCVDCGRQAEEWSYNHLDPDELYSERNGCAYSRNVDYYDPRCIPCHRTFDREYRNSRAP